MRIDELKKTVSRGGADSYVEEYLLPLHPDKLATIVSENVVAMFKSRDTDAVLSVDSVYKDGKWFICVAVSANIEQREAGICKAVSRRQTSFANALFVNSYMEPLVQSLDSYIEDGGTEEDFFDSEDVKVWITKASYEQMVLDAVEAVYKEYEIASEGVRMEIDVSLCKKQEIDNLKELDGSIVVGYAVKESENYLPIAVNLVNKIGIALTDYLISNPQLEISLCGKVMISVNKGSNLIDKIVMELEYLGNDELTEDKIFQIQKTIYTDCFEEILTDYITNSSEIDLLFNPTVSFRTGKSNRRYASDFYGSLVSSGDSDFYGRDTSFWGRVGMYLARYIARNIVSAGFSEEVLVQLTRKSEGISVYIESADMEYSEREKLSEILEDSFNYSEEELEEILGIRGNIIDYVELSKHGQVGLRGVSWEEDTLFE